jgi:hypothetical protein
LRLTHRVPVLRRRVFVGTLIVMALALAACGGSEPHGTVTGKALVEEGGVEVVTVAGHATITLRQGRRLVARTIATSGRTFSLSTLPGSYQISLHCIKPRHGVGVASAESVHITVDANKVSHVNLRCFVDAGVG